MAEPLDTILVRVSGPDKPGVTAGLMQRLAAAGAGMQDVEQIVIRGRLNLGVVITVPTGQDVIKELLHFGWEQQMEIDFEIVSDKPVPHAGGTVVTMVGEVITPAEFGSVATTVAKADGNIDRIIRLARYPVMAYELLISGGDTEGIRRELLSAARGLPCDISVQAEGLGRRAKRLIVLDVDSTLIQDEMIDVLARHAGVEDAVAAITERAMAGELDFGESLYERVRLLEGLPVSALAEVAEEIRLTPGARTFIRTLSALGYRTAIVSGGFTSIAEQVAAELGIDHAVANTLEVADGHLTGGLVGTIVDRDHKAEMLRRIAQLEQIPLEQVVAVGDGANDLAMLDAAGLGIAFNAKPVVQEAADTSLSVPYLDAVLFLLGVRRSDIEGAALHQS